MGQLEYDNTAFYYFLIAIVAVYLIPGWYYTIGYVLSAFSNTKGTARSELEKRKEAKMKVNQTGMDKLKNRVFLANVLSLVAFSLLFVYLVVQVMRDSKIVSFDPYEILGIDRGATDKQIKKGYKLKALEFHPDKNIGDEGAAHNFMLVAKAYEALTDDEARENWEKYGNPDGKQSFEMSIGLPTFLMEKDNQTLILLVYLVVMVVVIPSIVWAYYRQSQLYGEGNIMYLTYQNYANLTLRTDRPSVCKLKNFPELLCTAAEFEATLATGKADQEELSAFTKLFAKMNTAKSGGKKKGSEADSSEVLAKPGKWLEAVRERAPPTYWRIYKGNLLLHAHLNRFQILEHAKESKESPRQLSPEWSKSLDGLLTQSPALLSALLAILSENKKYESMLEVMKLSQALCQGVWARGALLRTAPFYQLPHVTADEVSLLGKQFKSLRAAIKHKFDVFASAAKQAEPHLGDDELRTMFMQMGPKDEEKLALDPGLEIKATKSMGDSQRADVASVLEVLPDVDVQVRHFVHDEDFVCERDTVTLEVSLTRHHVGEGGKAPPVHAPYFPSTKVPEEWWVVLKAEGDLRLNQWDVLMEKVVDQSKVVKTEIKFPAPPRAGKYKYTVHVVSSAYLGLDHEVKFEMVVESAAELPEIEDAYDDEDLTEEQALEATFGAGNVDSDVSDDEDDEAEAKGALAAAKARAQKARADGLTEAQAKKKEKRLAAAKGKGGDDGEDAVIVERGDADSSDDSSDGEELD